MQSALNTDAGEPMKIKGFVLLYLCFTSMVALGYDVDTHFYGTYSMARFSGIRHEVALKIATATQWMDESYISDPVSMILLPYTGIKKRRLLHFPGTRLANKLTTNNIANLHLPSLLDPSSGLPFKELTETEADHEFATEMFTEGMMEGDLMKAATGIHTLEDSFAHAGTISELGHAHFWHHPDRPYVDEASVEKYFKMARSVLRAMVAIRTLLPPEAVDRSTFGSDVPNYLLNGDQLADRYQELAEIKNAVSRKILNDPIYVKFALENVFQRAQKVNYVKDGYQNYLTQFTPGQDSYQAAEAVVRAFPDRMVDVSAVLKDSGYNPVLTPDFLLSMGGVSKFLGNIVKNFMSGIVPRPLDTYHRFEKEEDGPVWIKELDLRVGTMRGMIFKLYGNDIFFVANNTSTEKGFLAEISKSATAIPALPQANPKIQFVTYSVEEKAQFDQMVFAFLFPDLSAYMKDETPTLIKFITAASQVLKKDVNFENKLESIASYVSEKIETDSNKFSFIQAIKMARKDIANSHIIPHENNKFYAVPSLLQKQIASGIFKPLLTPVQLKALLK